MTKQQLEETQMQLMQNPQNNLLWMQEIAIQERIQQRSIEQGICSTQWAQKN